VGTWQWVAIYNGDSNNATANSGCTNEPVTVTQASPTIGTTASPTSEVAGSSALNDSALLSSGNGPTGTITFYLFSPTQSCSTTPAAGTYSYTYQVKVTGNGTYSTTADTHQIIPITVGTWHWLAVYSGDSNNTGTNSGCTSEPVVVTAPASKGFTMGFWGNNNGHAVLDPDHNGDIDLSGVDTTFTIGINAAGLRYATVATIKQSDKIVGVSIGACTKTDSFNLSCTKLPGGLQVQTLNVLAGQTLAAEYNFAYVSGFSSQTLGFLGCTIPTSLKAAPYNLSASSTMAQVIAVANYLIAHAVTGGSTTQQAAGDMNSLLGQCVNVK